MSNPAFGRADLDSLGAAHDLIAQWRTFLLTRFADYTHHAEVTPVRGGEALEPIEDVFARTNAGYGHFTLPDGWYAAMAKSIETDGENAAVLIEHRVSGDRGMASTVRTYRLPLDFALGEATETNPQYATYLRLKAQFEPAPDGGIAAEERRTAAQNLLAEAADRDTDYTQILEDPAVADDMYRKALVKANREIGGGQGDLIRHIHSLAAKVGLPKRPSNPLNPKRLEAARVLAVQSRLGNDPQPTREQIEALALPENRDQALLAYDRAMGSLLLRGGLGDIRGMVHAAADVLGLDTSFAERTAARQRLGIPDPTE